MQSQSDLLQLVLALRSTCRLTRLLHSRQQRRHKYRNNRDHHEQFNEREPSFPQTTSHGKTFRMKGNKRWHRARDMQRRAQKLLDDIYNALRLRVKSVIVNGLAGFECNFRAVGIR